MVSALLSLLLSASFALADTPIDEVPVEFLRSYEEVGRDMCRTEKPGIDGKCSPNGHSFSINFYLPQSLAETVLRHIAESKKRGYHDEISRTDLFHGHLMVRGKPAHYPTPEAYFTDAALILYHSAEYTNRWEHEAEKGIPADQRTPRSFVGWPNGTLQRAVDLTKLPLTRNYEGSGTVYEADLAESNPDLSYLFEGYYQVRNPTVDVCKDGDCHVCEPFGQFEIVKESAGRFEVDGERVEFFMRCFEKRDR
jgi:hypothetical protein